MSRRRRTARWSGSQWAPYVPVADRRAQALTEAARLRRKGLDLQPVCNIDRRITTTFWGQAWCRNLESYSDFENRLPRGRTYVRHGAVWHLGMRGGRIDAKVSGRELYDVTIEIKPLAPAAWKRLRAACAGEIGTLLELLQGRLSEQVMALVTDREGGLFPKPRQISMNCSCPDWAGMCKHVAAVMYGIGARLDRQPELLFAMRGVDHTELIDGAAAGGVVKRGVKTAAKTIDASALEEVFGIDLAPAKPKKSARRSTGAAPTKAKAAKSKKKKTKGKATARSRAAAAAQRATRAKK